MSRTSKIKWTQFLTIIVVLFFCSILSFISPTWAGFAILGFILGWMARFVVRRFRSSKRFRVFLLIVLPLFGLSFITMFLFIRGDIFSPTQWWSKYFPVFIRVPYSSLISYKSNTKQWFLQEEILLSKDNWHEIRRYQTLSRENAPQEFNEFIFQKRKLNLHGWKQEGVMGQAERFLRARTIHSSVRWFPARTTNKIQIDIGSFYGSSDPIILIPDSTSKLTIHAPKYFLGTTFPPPSTRSDLLEGNQESLTIPINLLAYDGFEVRLEVMSPLLRWRFGPEIGKLSLWDGLKWIFLAVCLVFSEQIRQKIITPLIAPLFGKRRAPDQL